MSAKEIESTAYLMGAFWVTLPISDARAEAEALRSMTWVAPRDLRYSACLRDAVVMIGEKPESFASWRAELLRENSFLTSGIAAYLTILASGTGSTEDENRVSSVHSLTVVSYRRNKPNAMRTLIVQTDI